MVTRLAGGRHTRLAMVTLVLGLLAPAAASAQSRTLGSPLDQAPNANFGCDTKPTLTAQSFDGFYRFLPSGQPDCTWFQSGVIGSVDFSDPRTGSVPGDGRITNVAVRSGPSPSALRVVIVRQIGGQPTAGCCAFVSETAPLQPQPNTVTNFAVDIPVERNVRGTSAVADFVGISGVSAAGTTLPLFSNGRNNTLSDYTAGNTDAGFFYPRMGALEAPGGGTRNNESIPGVEILLQWTWTPPGATPVVPPPVVAPPVVPPPAVVPAPPRGIAALRSRSAVVAAGRALVKLICDADAACTGALNLLSRRANAGRVRAASHKPTSYGKATYTIAAGRKATIKVKLNRMAKRLLRKHKRVNVDLRLIPKGGRATTSRLTLTRR